MSTTEAPALVDGKQGLTGPGPSWSWTADIDGPPTGPASLRVGVQWQQLPIGSQIEFSIPAGSNAQGSWPAIDSGLFTVSVTDGAYLVTTTWPGAVETTMTISWFQNGTPLPPTGANIQPMLAVMPEA